MSESLFFTILTLSELAFVTAALAVYLFFRNRNMSRELNDAQTQAPSNGAIEVDKDELNYLDCLQQNIDHTKNKLIDLPHEQAQALQARLAFLQAEVNAQKEAGNSEAYWNRLINDLDELLPHEIQAQETTPEANIPAVLDEPHEDRPVLSELDDIDIHDQFDTIPTLENHIGEGDGVRKDPSLTIESANDDMERLRKIISRQHNTMDELKKSLHDKDIDIDGNQELSKKLEEVEVAQAQLTMCVETLEKENERLNELIKEHEDSPHEEQLLQAKQDLDVANERINDLEKENTVQAGRITELESEISGLQQTLQQRNEELSRLQSQEADLSKTNESEEQNQDSLMQEIETLTDLITQKSDELSKLQNENSSDFEFNGDLAESARH